MASSGLPCSARMMPKLWWALPSFRIELQGLRAGAFPLLRSMHRYGIEGWPDWHRQARVTGMRLLMTREECSGWRRAYPLFLPNKGHSCISHRHILDSGQSPFRNSFRLLPVLFKEIKASPMLLQATKLSSGDFTGPRKQSIAIRIIDILDPRQGDKVDRWRRRTIGLSRVASNVP